MAPVNGADEFFVWLADRAADERADDGANFLGAHGSADGGLYACADGVLVLVRLRHPGADRAAERRALAEPDVVDAFVRADDCSDLFRADA